LYWGLGEYALASEDFTRYLETDPSSVVDLYLRGNSRVHLGDTQGALSDFNQVIAYGQNSSQEYERSTLYDAYRDRGKLYAGMNNCQQAIEDFSQALQNDPTDPTLYQYRGWCYRATGDTDKAIDDFTRAIEMIESGNASSYTSLDISRTYTRRGVLFYEAASYAKAIADLDRAIETLPDYDTPYLYRGLSYWELGDRDRAAQDFRQVLAVSSDEDTRQRALDALNQVAP
jgi:tetratricopeptide (TPR) repeat protein